MKPGTRNPSPRAAIAKRAAIGREHDAAGRRHDRVAGRHVPFGGRREARIDVGRALGEAAEFQRRAAGDRRAPARRAARNASLAGSKCERLTAATRSSAGHGRVWIASARRRRGLPGVKAQPFGAVTGSRRARSARAPAPRSRRPPACRRAPARY